MAGNPKIPETWPWAIAPVEGKGRGAVAKRDIRCGEVVAADVPLTLVPTFATDDGLEEDQEDDEGSHDEEMAGETAKKACHRCMRVVDDVNAEGEPCITCESCSLAFYCSASCKAMHKAELHPEPLCRVLASLELLFPDVAGTKLEHLILLLQCHFLKKGAARPFGSAENVSYTADGAASYADVLKLCEDPAAIEAAWGAEFREAADLYQEVVKKCLPAGEDRIAAGDAAGLLRRDAQNGFALTGKTHHSMKGTAVCPRLSMLNHACMPNCARIDYIDHAPTSEALGGQHPTTTFFRAIQPIPAGTELTFSYTPINYRAEERGEHLLETYGIVCSCSRCVLERQMEEMDGDEGMEEDCDEEHGVSPAALYNVFITRFVCPQPGCSGTLVPVCRTLDGSRRVQIGDIPGALSP
eukprot:gene7616-11664_t